MPSIQSPSSPPPNPQGPPRILLIATDLKPGGLPNRLAALAPRLKSRGFEPFLASLARLGEGAHDLTDAGIPTFSCRASGPFDASCLLRLARIVRQVNPDLIHASLFHANLAARLVGRIDRSRPIVTSSVTIEIERRAHRVLESLTSRLSDLHVANSRAVADHLRDDLGFDASLLRIILNGVDLDHLRAARPVDASEFGIPIDEPIVLWVGRMDPIKNLPCLVETAAQMRGARRFRMVLVGDGAHRPAIRTLIAARRLNDVIALAPWARDSAGWMKRATVLVLPSWTEGSSNVVLEAMAAGCPVIASDIPANRELIRDGITGRLCHPSDARQFAACITELMDRPDLRQSLTRGAAEFVCSHHSLDRAADHWACLYRELLDPASADR